MSRLFFVIAIYLLSELVSAWPQLDALCQRRVLLLASSSLLDLSHVVRLNGDWPTTGDLGDVASKVGVGIDVDPDVDGAARVPQFVCNALHQDEDRLASESGQVTLWCDIHTCMHARSRVCACVLICIHAYKHACIHTYMHTYIYTYIHTNMHA